MIKPNFRSLLLFLASLYSFISPSTSVCMQPSKKGYSSIKDSRLLANGSIATIDTFGFYRQFSASSDLPTYTRNLNYTFNFTKHEIIDDAVFVSDTRVLLLLTRELWSLDLSDHTFTKMADHLREITDFQPQSFKAPGVPAIVFYSQEIFVGFILYEESPVVYRYVYSGDIGAPPPYAENTFGRIEISTADFSAINEARMYYTVQGPTSQAKKLFYNSMNVLTTATSFSTWSNTTALEIVSKVIMHPTLDLMAVSGIRSDNFLGVVFFIDREFNDLFLANLDNYFDYGMFVEGSNTMVVYFQGGEFCTLDYDIGLKTATLGNCKMAPGNFLEPIQIFSGKILSFHLGSLSLYSYPEFDLLQMYSMNPSFSKDIAGTQYQYHIYANFKIKIFDTQLTKYLEGYDYNVEISSMVVNSLENPEGAHISYFVESGKKIQKFNFLEKKVLKTFEVLTSLTQLGAPLFANLDSCKVKGVDFYFESETSLLATIECHRIDQTRKRNHFLVKVDIQSGAMLPIEVPDPSGPQALVSNPSRRFRSAGALALKEYVPSAVDPTVKIAQPLHIVITACYLSYYSLNDPSDFSSGISFIKELDPGIYHATFESPANNYNFGSHLSDPYHSSRILASQETSIMKDIPSTFSRYDAKVIQAPMLSSNDPSHHNFYGYKGTITNCQDRVTPFLDEGIIKGKIFCFGASISRFTVSESIIESEYNDWNFRMTNLEASPGVGFFHFYSDELHIVTNFDSMFAFDSKSENCRIKIANEYLANKYLMIIDHSPNIYNCLRHAFVKECVVCFSGFYLSASKQCVAGNCQPEFPDRYLDSTTGVCREFCPYFHVQSGGVSSQTCSFFFCSGGDKKFGLKCFASCPPGSSDAGSPSDCKCLAGKIIHENGSCVDACTPEEYYMVVEKICISKIPDTRGIPFSVDEDRNIYCPKEGFLYSPSLNLCISEGYCTTSNIIGLNPKGILSCLEVSDCASYPDKLLDPVHKLCLEECQPGTFLNPGIKQCDEFCPVGVVYYSSEKGCNMRCNECESCLQDSFLNTTSKICQKKCEIGEVWVLPNNCQECPSNCLRCFNSTGECQVHIHNTKIINKSTKDQLSITTVILDSEGEEPLQEEYIDPSIDEILLYEVKIGSEEFLLDTTTKRSKSEFFTTGSLTNLKLPTGYYNTTLA